MTTQTEALKLALEALENNKQTHYYCEDIWYSCPQHEDGCANDSAGDECNCGADKANAEIDKAITAIKEALSSPNGEAQPEQEPTPTPNEGFEGSIRIFFKKSDGQWERLEKLEQVHEYNKQQWTQRTWVGLTSEERMDIIVKHNGNRFQVADEIEAKLREKNT